MSPVRGAGAARFAVSAMRAGFAFAFASVAAAFWAGAFVFAVAFVA
jgi:hypothetical protein